MKIQLFLVLLITLTFANEEWEMIYQSFHEQEINDSDGWIITNPYIDLISFNCQGTNIFGGHNIIGSNSTVSKLFQLPPHYKIKLDIQLWKMYSWDGESVMLMFDELKWSSNWRPEESWSFSYSQDFFHNSPTGSLLLTSSLDQDGNDVQMNNIQESWGFRDFTLSILRCPAGCQICGIGYLNQCSMFQSLALNWNNEISNEGWQFSGEGKASASICGGIQIYGGYLNFGRGAQLQKTFSNLPPHYSLKVMLQFWKIDSWDIINECFIIQIDQYQDRRCYSNDEGLPVCGAFLNYFDWRESIVNYEINLQHTLSQVQITLSSTLDEGADNESWGVRSFQLFAAVCEKGCKICSESTCQECLKGYDLIQGICSLTTKWLTNTKELFDNQNSEGWSVENVYQNQNQLNTVYQGQYIFGGQYLFGQNTKVQRNIILSEHSQIRIKFKFHTFNSHNNVLLDNIQLFVDGQLKFEQQTSLNLYGKYNDQLSDAVLIDQQIAHTNSNLVITIKTTQLIDADVKSWGLSGFLLFRDFKVNEVKCIEFYTECDFQGVKYELCRGQDDENNIPKIKSIKIPKGASVIIGNKEYSCDHSCIK